MTDQDRIKYLEEGIKKAFNDLHEWANGGKSGQVYQITRDLKSLLTTPPKNGTKS